MGTVHAQSGNGEEFVAGVGSWLETRPERRLAPGGYGCPPFRKVSSSSTVRMGGPEEPTGDAVQLTNQLLPLTQPLVTCEASRRQVVSPRPCSVPLYKMKGLD